MNSTKENVNDFVATLPETSLEEYLSVDGDEEEVVIYDGTN